MEPTVNFDVASQWGDQSLAWRGDPVENRTLQTFCVVRSRIRRAFLYLQITQRKKVKKAIGDIRAQRCVRFPHLTPPSGAPQGLVLCEGAAGILGAPFVPWIINHVSHVSWTRRKWLTRM